MERGATIAARLTRSREVAVAYGRPLIDHLTSTARGGSPSPGPAWLIGLGIQLCLEARPAHRE